MLSAERHSERKCSVIRSRGVESAKRFASFCKAGMCSGVYQNKTSATYFSRVCCQ